MMKSKLMRIISVLLVLLMLATTFGSISLSADEPELAFDGATVRVEEGLVVCFQISKAKLAGYDTFYMSYNKGGEEAVKVEDYIEAGEYYYFVCDDIAAKEMNCKIAATLTAEKNGVATTSAVLEYSVSDYCYDVLGDATADEWKKSLAASMLVYGGEAQKYFHYKEDELVTAGLTDEQKAMAIGADKNTLASVYENQPKDSAVAITGATIEHGNKPCLVVELTRATEGEVSGLTARLAWGDHAESVEETDFREINGKSYVFFNDLSFADFSETLTISVFRGRAPVSNTVKYSLESYVSEMKDDPETSEIALAMYAYAKAAAAIPETVSCEYGHQYEYEADIDDSYNLTVNNKCSACGELTTVTGKGFTGEDLWNSAGAYAAACTFAKSYDATQKSWKQKLVSCANIDNCYFVKVVTEKGIQIADYRYIVVYAKSDCGLKIGYKATVRDTWETTVFDTYGEWTGYVLEVHPEESGTLKAFKVDLLDLTAGNTVYINSIALFATEEEAKTYAGAFGHTWVAESEISDDHELTGTGTCSFCGKTKSLTGKGLRADHLYSLNLGSATTYNRTELENAVNYELGVDTTAADNYFTIPTGDMISLTDYNYLVIYMKSTCDVNIRIQGYATDPLDTTFEATDRFTAWVIDVSAKTGDLGTVRFDPQTNAAGTTICINSIAVFANAEEANAYGGASKGNAGQNSGD